MRKNLISHRVARLLGVAMLMTTAVTGAVTASAAPASASGFGQMPGSASDVGVGANGAIWVIGTIPNNNPYGFNIYRWNRSRSNWDLMPGAGAEIDVDPGGNAWVANYVGDLYHYNGSGWDYAPAPAQVWDVGVGANGQVWIIAGPGGPYGDSNIYARVGTGWVQIAGAAKHIDVDPNGNAWVVTNAGNIYWWGGSWNPVPGGAFDIGIGARGDVWVTGNYPCCDTYGYPIYRWNGSGWAQVAGSAVNISSGANNDPVVRNRATDIYRWGN